MEFTRKQESPWDTYTIADGQELKVGVKIYNGNRTMLVNGVEASVAEQCYGGDVELQDGRIITIVDGVITEIKQAPSIAAQAMVRKEKYKKR